MPHRYTFASSWHLPVPPDVVFAELERLDRYPMWWRQVRAAERIDDNTCRLVVRSVLPYDLRVTAHRLRADPAEGVLAARLSDDLVGTCGWRLIRQPDGTRVEFTEEVEAQRPLLRRLAVARPALQANHAWMMRCGERGLRRHLMQA
ncbi:MAG TPA: SRPBCC family protein [Sporichthyaceae bacterium]|jgi:hypothetical protein|nr:SRPBCC family protein [Sporichthyaceae bacterium]